MSPSVRDKGPPNRELMAATMVIGLWRLAISFGTIDAGPIYWSSVPRGGSNTTIWGISPPTLPLAFDTFLCIYDVSETGTQPRRLVHEQMEHLTAVSLALYRG
jgi:hypothetical protein